MGKETEAAKRAEAQRQALAEKPKLLANKTTANLRLSSKVMSFSDRVEFLTNAVSQYEIDITKEKIRLVAQEHRTSRELWSFIRNNDKNKMRFTYFSVIGRMEKTEFKFRKRSTDKLISDPTGSQKSSISIVDIAPAELSELVSESWNNAVMSALEGGHAVTYIEDGRIIEEHKDGSKLDRGPISNQGRHLHLTPKS